MSVNVSRETITDSIINTGLYCMPRWFETAPHLERIEKYLLDPSYRRLIFTVPPQHGKTTLITQLYPAWEVGQNPDANIISTAYNASRAHDYSFATQSIIKSEEYQRLFDIKLHADFAQRSNWKLEKFKGGMLADGILGGITGNPAKILLIDDPIKNHEEAFSKVYRKKVWDAYITVLKTRLSEDGRIIIVMTRWHHQDLVGKILQEEKDQNKPKKDRFKVINLPAITSKLSLPELAEQYKAGKKIEATALWPEKKSVEFLMEKYVDSPTSFTAMYQGEPRAESDFLIRREWFDIVDTIPPENTWDAVYRYYDLAFKTKEQNDHTATCKMIKANGVFYIAEVIWWKKTMPESMNRIKSYCQADGTRCTVGVEDVGGQGGIVQILQADNELMRYSIRGIPTTTDKTSRAQPWIIRAKDGLIKIVKGSWNAPFFEVCEQFGPSCDIDDPIDAVSGAYQMASQNSKLIAFA